ncbi:MAG: COQ9 family protein [Alphaproteobacteria bacterium]|nr:COQ9 family protein [Alphaproteobacteria bacterium]
MTETDADHLDPLRRRLLEAALPHIPFDGWSAISLNKAARDIGEDEGTAGMAFPGGARDLLDFFARDADARMLARLDELDIGSMRIRDRIRTAVRSRIEAVAAHKEAERRALSFLSLPGNAPLGLRMASRTVDLMWRAAGDASTDFSFYTKRLSLGGVYTSTVLFWVADSSENSADTWAFLDRRIEDVMTVEKAKARLRERLNEVPSLAACLSRLRYPGETRMKP